jgi:C4-dicarboxylate transporter, DctQ subunit
MVDRILAVVHALLAAARVVAGILLICSVAINFANIIGRYFFSVSISWAEEIMLFLMVGCVFLGSASVAWANRQIRMDMIISMMPDPVRKTFDLLAELVFLATAVLLTIFAWPVIVDLAAFDERSQAANFPLVIPQAMLPIGLSIMACLVAIRLLTRSASREAAAARRTH